MDNLGHIFEPNLRPYFHAPSLRRIRRFLPMSRKGDSGPTSPEFRVAVVVVVSRRRRRRCRRLRREFHPFVGP